MTASLAFLQHTKSHLVVVLVQVGQHPLDPVAASGSGRRRVSLALGGSDSPS